MKGIIQTQTVYSVVGFRAREGNKQVQSQMVKFAETDELCSQLSRLPSPEPEKSPSISGETNRYAANGNKTLNKQDLSLTNY